MKKLLNPKIGLYWVKLTAAIFFAAVGLPSTAQQAKRNYDIDVIPRPAKVIGFKEVFTITHKTSIQTSNAEALNVAGMLKQHINAISGITLNTGQAKNSSNTINLKIDSTTVSQREGYHLVIHTHQITLSGHDEAGLFYGLQTLTQLIKPGAKSNISLRGCDITDYPRFAYRGMHLDVSRHMFTVTAIKKWLTALAAYKINTFHWHLTDDQGWRIEIKKYPLLQSIAAYRSQTLIGHKREWPHLFDGKKYGGFYSQDDIKDMIQYAAKLHITIIPEIEMPGHAMAALAAYPSLGCTGGPYQTATYWGVFDDVYCAGNEATFTFLEGVLDEVATLFPSKYIHIGGDECPKSRWKACPKCQQRIKDEHLADESQLQSYFIKRISNYLASYNKKIIGWDEILEGGLTPGATVMSWTGEHGGIESAKQGHNVIMTPEKQVYLDYYQSLYPQDSIAAGGYTPLNKIYKYDPVPQVLTAGQAQYIIGVQANVWTEYMPNTQKAEYMMFPRILALAEIAWSPKKQRNLKSFLRRIRAGRETLSSMGINAANNFDQITDSISSGKNGMPLLHLTSVLKNAVIRYTTNGRVPNQQSKLYQSALLVDKTCIVKAGLFTGTKSVQEIYTKKIAISKATGKKVTLVNQPSGNYNPQNTGVMVNGVTGSRLYNDGEWFGFSGTDLDAVINLDSLNLISNLGINVLNYHWQKMWAPVELIFSVSADGVNYQTVYQQNNFPVNGINTVRAKIAPVKAQYIKVKAINQRIIPTGEYGAGGKPWLLADEFFVN
ncbi:beta-N-acetylhexosaminidase [Mucilaginibacter phyllosphaerae]|uniref:beta-N-acetylhexosaminidase n=1 Tax=Mucilaginibacter phyllosphaerae TaxID=1812349 RepID=A0ABR6IDK6_9SPHI|nr:family 20 glycosylhydrolase [Mucilaginibacter phyllosphaerae]MBB3971140.1 hexosaminidase [Mucilaginibacter phyllosphaerae]